MPLKKTDIGELFEFDDWANERLLQMVERAFGERADLRAAQDRRVVAVQETLAHIVAARQIWRRRWQGEAPDRMLDPAGYPTVAALRVALQAEADMFDGFFGTIGADADLERIVTTRSTTGEPRVMPLRRMMQHVINHGAYHRGQVTARLIDLGHEAVVTSTDFAVWFLLQNPQA